MSCRNSEPRRDTTTGSPGGSVRLRLVTAITVSDAQLAVRRAVYEAALPGHFDVTLVNAATEGPATERIESRADLRSADEAVRSVLREEIDADLLVPDCVLDPAYPDYDGAPVPVLGMFEAVAGHVRDRGRTFRVVARNEIMAARLTELSGHYGVDDTFGRAVALEVPSEHAFDASAWAAHITGLLDPRDATPVFVACTGIDIPALRAAGIDAVGPIELFAQALGSLTVTSPNRNPRAGRGVVPSPDPSRGAASHR